jgi:hypothetical protein
MVDEFDNLFIDGKELDKMLLKNTLDTNVRLTTDGRIIFEREFDPRKKILFYLLANKILVLRNIKTDEAEGPTTICKNIGIPEGTAKAYVIRLEKEKLVSKTRDGKYYVPNYYLEKVKTTIQKS